MVIIKVLRQSTAHGGDEAEEVERTLTNTALDDHGAQLDKSSLRRKMSLFDAQPFEDDNCDVLYGGNPDLLLQV